MPPNISMDEANGPIFNFKKNFGGITMNFTIFILNRKNKNNTNNV